MNELKACPFCGGKAAIYGADSYFIACCRCEAQTKRHRNVKEAITDWNRRAATENKPLTMERLRQMDGEPVWVKPTKGIAKWYLVDVAEEGCADCDMGMVDFELYGSQQSYGWLAYARKPEGNTP